MADHWTYGFHPVAQRLPQISSGVLLVRSGKVTGRVETLMALAASKQIAVERVSLEAFDQRLGAVVEHQGLALLTSEAPLQIVEDLDVFLAPKDQPRTLLVLDGVTDPGNLGACLRSALTFGVDAVVVPKHGSAPLNAIVMKRSAGAAAEIPVVEVVNLSRSLRQMKSAGYWVVGTALGAEIGLNEFDLRTDIVLVMGSEGEGLRFNTRKQCDCLVEIPMYRDAFNLNVSVATGICLYELHRQRST
ncbi:MAG: 23S rRNA (guanosine(2251)-2'-O)-methyltransferase RlmB [Pseudomonadales bacterium]